MTTPTPDPNQQLSDTVIALLRTGVPLLWGLLASWLISLGIPAGFIASVHGLAVAALTAVASIAWYAVWKWASPHVPAWLVVLVLGYAANPAYTRLGRRASAIPLPRAAEQ